MERIDAEDLEWRDGKWAVKAKPIVKAATVYTEATEDEVWEECRQRLEQHGFYPAGEATEPPKKLVHGYYLSTQQRRRSTVSEGLPDVFIALAGVPVWFPLELKSRELKSDGGLKAPRLTVEQRELHKAGCICIVRCAADIDHIVNSLRRLFAHEQLADMFTDAARVPSGGKQ